MSQLPANIESAFFKPVSFSLLESLINGYDGEKQTLTDVATFLQKTENERAVRHFVECANTDTRTLSLTDFLNMDNAIAKLNSDYWQRAMNETDIMKHMPQTRKSEWNDMIHERKTPPFNTENVKATFQALLQDRPRFMAEKVDGFFKTLSGEHVTNSKTGFTKRMIINGFIDQYGSCNYEKSGCLFDLRDVMRKISGRDVSLVDTSTLVREQLHIPGEWVTWDGGLLRVKVFKKGTLHLEIHPDIAWQLNTIIAFLHPMTLSDGSTKPPTKQNKDFGEFVQTIPHTIRENLHKCRVGDDYVLVGVIKESIPLLESIGGVFEFREQRSGWDGSMRKIGVMVFDYDPTDVIRHIIITGTIPDKKSHQFYPTPKELGETLVWDMCNPTNLTKDINVLEPSAGVGHLADHMTKATVHCYELSTLHSKVLESKGYTVLGDDFLKSTPMSDYQYVIMNPPFANGRAKLHVEHALGFLADDGVLGAILPASLLNHYWGDQYDVSYSDVISGAFVDANVNVVKCIITKK